MKNISLMQVTFVVVAMALASSLVNAGDVMPKVMPKNIPEIEAPKSANIEFEQLDLDKNNLISLVETERYEIIHDAFTKIDSNSDATISKDEFAEFKKK